MSNAKPRQASRKSSGGGFLIGVFVGLFVGLAIAVGIAFYLNKAPVPFVGRSTPPAKGAETAAAPKGAEKSEKPRFDFYRILPGGEEPVSEKELREREKSEKSAAAAKSSPPEAARDTYFIQAGAFQNPADADGQKAKLALLGLESSVEPTNVPDKGTWYRVRLGPYSRVDEINRVRALLAQNGIDGNLVKIKDSSPGKAN